MRRDRHQEEIAALSLRVSSLEDSILNEEGVSLCEQFNEFKRLAERAFTSGKTRMDELKAMYDEYVPLVESIHNELKLASKEREETQDALRALRVWIDSGQQMLKKRKD